MCSSCAMRWGLDGSGARNTVKLAARSRSSRSGCGFTRDGHALDAATQKAPAKNHRHARSISNLQRSRPALSTLNEAFKVEQYRGRSPRPPATRRIVPRNRPIAYSTILIRYRIAFQSALGNPSHEIGPLFGRANDCL